MYILKLFFFQKIRIDNAHPGSWEKQPTSWGTAKDCRLGTSGGIRAIVFQAATEDHPPMGMANCPGRECCIFLHIIFPEFQNPSPYLVYSLL